MAGPKRQEAGVGQGRVPTVPSCRYLGSGRSTRHRRQVRGSDNDRTADTGTVLPQVRSGVGEAQSHSPWPRQLGAGGRCPSSPSPGRPVWSPKGTSVGEEGGQVFSMEPFDRGFVCLGPLPSGKGFPRLRLWSPEGGNGEGGMGRTVPPYRLSRLVEGRSRVVRPRPS